MRASFTIIATSLFIHLPLTAHAVDCSPFRPDSPVSQSNETDIKAEVNGLLSKLVEADGEYRVSDAQEALGAGAKDPDSLIRWQSKLYYFCEALNEDKAISTRDRVEIMRGIMDASTDAQIDDAIKDDVKRSEIINSTVATSEGCVVNNQAVSCDFILKTSETAKELIIYADAAGLGGSSRLTDNQGNSYLASKIEFGGAERSSRIQTSLPADIPMRGRLTFEKVSTRATSAALLEIATVLDREEMPPFMLKGVRFE